MILSRLKQDVQCKEGFKPVLVDQRALVDKMLARYSGEFTVFRELLQNSDDAGSTSAEISFRSDAPSKSTDLDSTPVSNWTIRNNGRAFTDDDWNRLTKIGVITYVPILPSR
ncbi:hypothetical protein JVU11DRAFT_6878 [Chiua virens]|nr:hypothetical protein JVU11DRAFT_6878 [Chiua virens]